MYIDMDDQLAPNFKIMPYLGKKEVRDLFP